MPIFTILLFTLLAALGAGWLATRGRLTRRRTWSQARAADRANAQLTSGPDTTLDQVGGSLRWSVFHDGMTWMLRRSLARAQRRSAKVAGAAADVLTRLVAYHEAAAGLVTASTALRRDTSARPALSLEVAGRLAAALYLGDIAVVSGILMAENASLPLVLAMITSLALATAQFALGKMLGDAYVHFLEDRSSESGDRLPLLVPAILLGVLGLSLAILLLGGAFAWAFLAVTPALGAAALTVISHHDASRVLFRAERAHRKPRRRFVRAVRRLGVKTSRAASAWTAAGTLASRNLLAREQAVAASYGITTSHETLVQELHNLSMVMSNLDVVDTAQLDAGVAVIINTLQSLGERIAELEPIEQGEELIDLPFEHALEAVRPESANQDDSDPAVAS